jgi:hypothetical protein
MPDARSASTGNKTTVSNIGGNDFTLRDATGGTIQFIGTGEQWVIVLTDNTTEAGTWSAFQLGAATTLASASALAGAGLQADGFGLLEQIIDSDVEAATPITVVDGDRAKCLIYTAGAGTCNLPTPGTVGNNWFFMLRNSGSGTLNIVPGAGTIDGSANINLDPKVPTSTPSVSPLLRPSRSTSCRLRYRAPVTLFSLARTSIGSPIDSRVL